MVVDYEKLGLTIKKIRESRHISQAELAETAETSVQHISNIETAKKAPSLDMIIRIATALEVSFSTLLNGNVEKRVLLCNHEFNELIGDCSEYERAIIYDMAQSAKKSMRENQKLLLG